MCISGDQSWRHTSIAGDAVARDPNFDVIAQRGILFTHAFTISPSCTPSRHAELEAQGDLEGTLATLAGGVVRFAVDLG